jgi:hypothetical protein
MNEGNKRLLLIACILLSLSLVTLEAKAQKIPPCPKGQKWSPSKKGCVPASVGSSTIGCLGCVPDDLLFRQNERVIVELAPFRQAKGKGQAEVTRVANLTKVNLKIEGMTGQDGKYAVYAVHTVNGQREATLLGPINIVNGTGQLQANTQIDRFALVITKSDQVNQITDDNLMIRSTVVKSKVAVP